MRGQWCTDPAKINEIIGDYFTHILSSKIGSCDEVIQCVEPKLTAEQNHSLTEPFTVVDVRDVIFSKHPDKSPSPDSMNLFFQKFWSIVSIDVSSAYLDFIRQCEFPIGLMKPLLFLSLRNLIRSILLI